MTDPDRSLDAQIRRDLAIPADEWPLIPSAAHPVALPARTDVAGLAWSSVAAASAAAASLSGSDRILLDPDRIAIAYTSDRHLRLDGEPHVSFAPLSGFFRTADGWVRTHGNYPWHADALRRALGLSPDDGADAAAAAFAQRTAAEVSDAITAAGGLCVAVASEDPAQDARLARQPIVAIEQVAPAPRRPLPGPSLAAPLAGIRVLDLTRVIAGPIATRTLALLGADVLRIDPPARPEIAAQHLDTGHGKHSALLDLNDTIARARFEELLADADVIVLGYRPRGLAALGLDPHAIAARHPGIVIAQLTAWGEPDRRGFDSLVQAASGIAWVESSDGEKPGVLPAQALDHSAGYLLSAAIMTLLSRRAQVGGTWLASTSLRRIAAHLLTGSRMPDAPPAPAVDVDRHTQRFRVDGVDVVTAAPAVAYAGGPTDFAPPRPWGADAPEWTR